MKPSASYPRCRRGRGRPRDPGCVPLAFAGERGRRRRPSPGAVGARIHRRDRSRVGCWCPTPRRRPNRDPTVVCATLRAPKPSAGLSSAPVDRGPVSGRRRESISRRSSAVASSPAIVTDSFTVRRRRVPGCAGRVRRRGSRIVGASSPTTSWDVGVPHPPSLRTRGHPHRRRGSVSNDRRAGPSRSRSSAVVGGGEPPGGTPFVGPGRPSRPPTLRRRPDDDRTGPPPASVGRRTRLANSPVSIVARSGAVERLDDGGDRVGGELAFGSTVVQRRRERFDAVVPDDVLELRVEDLRPRHPRRPRHQRVRFRGARVRPRRRRRPARARSLEVVGERPPVATAATRRSATSAIRSARGRSPGDRNASRRTFDRGGFSGSGSFLEQASESVPRA